MVAQLQGLSQHADPAVRSASIRQLGQWDKSGESEERLTQALADGTPEVRQAAIFAIAQASVRAPGAKAALLALASNPLEPREVRGSAMQVLERFALSKEEYAAIAPVRAQMRGR
ncbi:MAG: repeat protein [Massilia sp.]|nr:repeat protein [Massilia sp.]MDB5792582.1 repeat protein [Massilia sp.]